MRKVIITGASGFIGRALAAHFLQAGCQVYAVVRNAQTLAEFNCENIEIFEADLSEYIHLPTKILERDFDCFYHLAWDGTSGEDFKDYHKQLKNAACAADAITAATELHCKKFVLASTIVSLEAKHYMVTDGGNPRVSCNYGTAKAAAEMLCKTLAPRLDIDFNTAMIANAYGVGDRSNMIQNVLIRTLQRGECPPLIGGEKLYDWIYIDDVVSALATIGQDGKANTTYYVGHRELQSFQQLVTLTRDIVAPSVELKFGTLADTTAIDYSLIDRNALFRDTGFFCRADFAESIRYTAQWLQTQDAL